MDIIDVLERPELAEDEKILATDRLIKVRPHPSRRIIGHLTDKAKVLEGLDAVIRRELFRLSSVLKKTGTTAFITAERTEEHGAITRHGVEEFVADNVIILRNYREDEKRRRTIEILKFRGTMHQKGEYPFTIQPSKGVVVIPLSAMELKQKSSNHNRFNHPPSLCRAVWRDAQRINHFKNAWFRT
jgi:KaiC/GvpD/RAD55 family RecA-like ATPase